MMERLTLGSRKLRACYAGLAAIVLIDLLSAHMGVADEITKLAIEVCGIIAGGVAGLQWHNDKIERLKNGGAE